jgi:hypothetical protein
MFVNRNKPYKQKPPPANAGGGFAIQNSGIRFKCIWGMVFRTKESGFTHKTSCRTSEISTQWN